MHDAIAAGFGKIVFVIRRFLKMRFVKRLPTSCYYKTHRPGHNLDRCRTQLQLLRRLNNNQEAIDKIIDNIDKE